MPEEKIYTGIIQVQIVCPVCENVIEEKTVAGKEEPRKLKCGDCWDEIEVNVPGIWVRV